MRELGKSFELEKLKNSYTYFVNPELFVHGIVIISFLYAFFYPLKRSAFRLILDILTFIFGWILFWELFVRLSNILVIQYFLEGNYSTSTLFFGGLATIGLIMECILSLVGVLFIYLLRKGIRNLVATKPSRNQTKEVQK